MADEPRQVQVCPDCGHLWDAHFDERGQHIGCDDDRPEGHICGSDCLAQDTWLRGLPMPDAHATETLAEVRLTDAEVDYLYPRWQQRVSFTHLTAAVARILAARIVQARAGEEAHRDLVRRLGFGDNITEPMADNDTIVAWFEQQSRDANEWQESQLWRNDCYEAGHPDDEDCYEHDPALRLERAEARAGEGALRERVAAVLADGDHDAFCDQDDECECWRRRIRAALDTAGDPT